jgi:hypothetical protein
LSDEILQKIKSKGYWKITILPSEYRKDRTKVSEIKTTVEKCQVRKRGWPYPYVPQYGDIVGSELISNDYYTCSIDWRNHLEEWRMYRSGQFVHYLALREDWSEEKIAHVGELKVLEIVLTLYSTTEVFLFISNLGLAGFYDGNILVQMELHDVYDRILAFYVMNYRKFRELHNVYKCKMEEPIRINKTIKKLDIISSNQSISMNVLEEVFEKFGWTAKIGEILRGDQDEFIKGLI